MTQETKTTREIIVLDDIALDVFQLPNGSYRYASTQAFINIAAEGYIQKTASKQAQTLIPQWFSYTQKVKLNYRSRTSTLVAQEEINLCWAFQTQNENYQALASLKARISEALERRADAAFGIKPTEESRTELERWNWIELSRS
jgi:hypothetical protein